MKIVALQHHTDNKEYYVGFCHYQGKFVLLKDKVMAMRFASSDYASRMLEAITYMLDYEFRHKVYSVHYLDAEDASGEP